MQPVNANALRIPNGNGFFFTKGFTHPGSKPYPYFFADQNQRSTAMTDKMISVLAAQVGR